MCQTVPNCEFCALDRHLKREIKDRFLEMLQRHGREVDPVVAVRHIQDTFTAAYFADKWTLYLLFLAAKRQYESSLNLK